MSDLISRNSVINVLKETGIIQDNDLGHLVIDEINRIPTAYDEEQGLLMRFPCKVGDTVYAIGFNNNSPIVYEAIVLRILITGKEIDFEVKVDEFEINAQLKKSMFGKTVFLTQSEAEAALAEIQSTEAIPLNR